MEKAHYPIPPRSAATLRAPHEPDIAACVRLIGWASCRAESGFNAQSGRFGYSCRAPTCPVRVASAEPDRPSAPSQGGGSLYRPPVRKRR